MNIISWQEIAGRLLFAFIVGSTVAIEKRWYQTKQFILSNIQMALGAAMFSILASLTSETKLSSQLILGISILCAALLFQKQERLVPTQNANANVNVITKLWCAGAAGSLVGSGLFFPAYIAILIILLTNLLFPAPEKDFMPNIEKELKSDFKPKTEVKSTTKSVAQEIRYQYRVNCLAVDESDVLALLVQLGKEQELIPTKVSSRNLVGDHILPEIEVQIDFISDRYHSPLELQQVLISLKSKIEVSSASWSNLSSELNNNSDAFLLEN